MSVVEAPTVVQQPRLMRVLVSKCTNEGCGKYEQSGALSEDENRRLTCRFCGGHVFELSWWMACAPTVAGAPEVGSTEAGA